MIPGPPLCDDPRLDRVVRSEFPHNPHVVDLIDAFWPHRRHYHPGFVGALFEIGGSPTAGDRTADPDRAWEARRLAALMLHQQFLRLAPGDVAASIDFLGRLGLLTAGRLSEEVLKEGYTTTDPAAFLAEFRRVLRRLQRVLSPLGREAVAPRALRTFLGASREECGLTLARYLVSPAEVAGRVRAQVRRSEGEPAPLKFAYTDDEAGRRLDALPRFEAEIVRAFHGAGETFWAGPRTESRLNALVEQPAGTVVVVVKPPGSRFEFEIKRAGRPGVLPLGIVHDRGGVPVPPSHRLDGGSAGDTLQWETGQSACLAKIYRLVHRAEAPISITTSITYPDSLPVGEDRRVHLLDYFSDPDVFGDDFPRMRHALRQAVEAFRLERGARVSGLQGEWGETLEFLQYQVPAQSILVGSTSFRVDLLARHLSTGGDFVDSEDPSCASGRPGDARRFADAVLDEVLGLYRPPGRVNGPPGAYLDAAFARPENRARADRLHASVTGQVGSFWGTLLALRGFSNGESFVARNVGLRTVWERGRWRVRVIFMDHDNLHLPAYAGDVFDPDRCVPALIRDENHVVGRVTAAGYLPGTLDRLRAIYRVDDATAARHRLVLARSMARAYRKTLRRLSASKALAKIISPGYIATSRAWDDAAAIFLRRRAEGGGSGWADEAGAVLRSRDLGEDLVARYLASVPKHAPFLDRYAFLFSRDRPGEAPGTGP